MSRWSSIRRLAGGVSRHEINCVANKALMYVSSEIKHMFVRLGTHHVNSYLHIDSQARQRAQVFTSPIGVKSDCAAKTGLE